MAEFQAAVQALEVRIEALAECSDSQHRLRRSTSWLKRAGSEKDIDTRCILLWVAFNAAYAIDRNAARQEWGTNPKEWELQKRYLEKLTRLDARRIHGTIAENLWNAVVRIMNNEYVYSGFWESLTKEDFDWSRWDGKPQFDYERRETVRRLRTARIDNTLYVLDRVFSRLTVLRNQLVHGCATQEGTLNRRQINDGAEILEVLVPVFVGIMAEHPEEGWGKISFPVRKDIREDCRHAHLGVHSPSRR